MQSRAARWKTKNPNERSAAPQSLRLVVDNAQAIVQDISMTKRKKNPAAVSLGKLGGAAGTGKAKARTSAQARYAALVRWGKAK